MEYSLGGPGGSYVVFRVRNCVLITLAVVATLLAGLLSMGLAALVYSSAPQSAASLGVLSLLLFVNTAVLSHLKHKADIYPGRVDLESVDGSVGTVVKDSSVWITLLLAFTVLGMLGSLGVVAYSVAVGGSTASGIGAGIVVFIVFALYARILWFLRTRLMFKGDRVLVPSREGVVVELYKDRSFWITLALAMALLAGVVFIGVGVYSLATGAPLYEPGTGGSLYAGYEGEELYTGSAGLAFVVGGLFFLVYTAVLNFLRVKTMLRASETGETGAVSIDAGNLRRGSASSPAKGRKGFFKGKSIGRFDSSEYSFLGHDIEED